MQNKVLGFLFIVILGECYGANILAVFPIPGLSHFVMFSRLLKGLAEKGHEVDVVSSFPSAKPIERYNDISIRGSSPIFTNNFTANLVMDISIPETIHFIIEEVGVNICENSFKAENMKKLKNSKKKYDLVITELFTTDCMLGWAWYFGVPSVVMTSSSNFPWATDRFGQPDNPSYLPTYFVEYESEMTLYERIINTWTLVMGKILYYFYSTGPSNTLAKEFFGEDMPDLNVLAYNTSLHLLNTHFSINNARPLVPNIIEVGGLHIEDLKPLNEHFASVLKTDTRGIIYLTMGSLVLTETLPPKTLQAMFDAFAELPYKVVWKAKKENLPKNVKFPQNIHFEPWMPQLDILCDSRVKLFVSHGGMMGTQEAVYCGKPILGLPIFADQKLNLKHAESMGFAIMLDFKTLTKDGLLTAAKKILYDQKYSENAMRKSEEFKDRPRTPLETSIYWIEYVIRHKGAPNLQSTAKTLSWYQYYLLDVIAVTLGIPSILIYLLIVLFKFTRVKKEKLKIK